MRTVWKTIPEFEKYEVNQYGEFVNARTDHPIKTFRTQSGHAKISIYDKSGILRTRSAGVIVASLFLEEPPEEFDTVIHLDGDYMNCAAHNLMWRPRWFAIRYHKQFNFDSFHTGYAHPTLIQDRDTGKRYSSIKEVCTTEGLYYFDVYKSILEETFTPITGQYFQYV